MCFKRVFNKFKKGFHLTAFYKVVNKFLQLFYRSSESGLKMFYKGSKRCPLGIKHVSNRVFSEF